MKNKKYLCAETKDKNQPKGQLNPDWVEWLMGWPLGWSGLEPIKEFIWITWDEDPADTDSFEVWATPNASARSGRNPKTGKGEGLYYQVREKGSDKMKGLIPRVGTNIKDRINRLKAIGNGQVPQCAAMAYKILTDEEIFLNQLPANAVIVTNKNPIMNN